MNEDIREYFKTELEHFQKSYELQFNHFMGVFYFWIAVVTLPATAGLLSTDKDIPWANLAYLSLMIAILSLFVSAKMFDIRCSQLVYLSIINEIRNYLHDIIKQNIPSTYHSPFPLGTNFRVIAFTDFGVIMAVIMSGVNALFFGAYINLYQVKGIGIDLLGFAVWLLIGFVVYSALVFWRIPRPNKKAA